MSPTAPATGSRRVARRPATATMLAVGAAVLAADQASKSLALSQLADGAVDVFWTLRFNLAFNSGLAFGQGRGLTPFITVAGLVLVAGLVWFSRRLTRPAAAVALGLLLGGACGNLTDRLARGHGGAVVDFIDLRWWPVFNLADVAITTGAVLLLLVGPRETRPAAEPEPELLPAPMPADD